MFNNWIYFLDVVTPRNIFVNPSLTKQFLTPFSIKHADIKRKIQQFRLEKEIKSVNTNQQ